MFLYLKEPIEQHIEKQSTRRKILYVVILLFVLTLPTVLTNHDLGRTGLENLFGDLNIIAFLITISISYVLEKKYVNYDNKVDKKWKIFVRILFGIAVLGLYMLYDGLYDPDVITLTKMIADLIVYTILGPIAILLVPWIIKKLKL